MKRVVFIAVFILIILLVFIYVFIPSTITNSKTVSVKCIDKNMLLLVGNKQGWIKWLPQESFTSDLIQYKDYQIRLGSATYTSVLCYALKDIVLPLFYAAVVQASPAILYRLSSICP